MADVFYDVTHPVRRDLHRRYIRHCLDMLGAHSNVIYLTGEEFTGPLEFVQFWLDTVTDWEKETGKNVLLGISATKDVQDAILADRVRGPRISVIDLKYWWYTRDGTLYAPEGGKNLAPRQQLREWKGPKGRSDAQTARQIREYRDRYPDKAILCADGSASPWAVLAAGGSMPALPRQTDARLLAVLPRLKPAGAENHTYVLGDPGHDYLAVSLGAGPLRIDLSPTRASFSAYWIDPQTGRATPSSEAVEGGKIVEIPSSERGLAVLWLTR